jgi:hypothetical protein
VNPRSSKPPKNSTSVEAFKGSKSKKLPPKSFKIPKKLNNLLKLLQNPRGKKKRKKVHPNAPSYQNTEHLLKTLKRQTAKNCHPKILQATKNSTIC